MSDALNISSSTIRTPINAAIGLASPSLRRGALADWQLKRVRLYVETHLENRVSCADLAATVRLSRSQFGRVFRASTGQTPHSYVMGRRVARAQTLMRETSMPLSQIALECGMSDQSHLCRVFGARIGMSPRAWRRRH
jgi:AraC family transcriptional regulator